MWLDGKEQVKRLVFDDTCLQASGVALWVSLGEIFRASSLRLGYALQPERCDTAKRPYAAATKPVRTGAEDPATAGPVRAALSTGRQMQSKNGYRIT